MWSPLNSVQTHVLAVVQLRMLLGNVKLYVWATVGGKSLAGPIISCSTSLFLSLLCEIKKEKNKGKHRGEMCAAHSIHFNSCRAVTF